ncbi:MAG: FAD-dependent oxidoreductase, partial [Nocardioides sp.]|uniref:NAD(P)/FAD-dependent oxidoreductase n=1 Tax=Nocardioides sp. TaxID=35761 RepID=UPI0039E2D238
MVGRRAGVERVVIVGGGVGGLACAQALRAHGYAGGLVILDPAPFPYDRPPLSKDYLAGSVSLEGIALATSAGLAEQGIDWQRATVTALRAESPEVDLADGRTLAADRIVLALGGDAIRPPIPGADSARVHVVRDVADADRLREALGHAGEGARVLVVGAGLIGAETASTLNGLGASVTLVDPVPTPLAGAVGPELATWLHARHRAYGVETIVGTVQALQETSAGLAAQLSGEPDSRAFDVAVIGVGMSPRVALAEQAGIEVDRGILVDRTRTTSRPAVLAIGDCARLRDHARAEHWEAAQHDGQRAAAAILGVDPPATVDGAPWFWTDRYGLHVEAVGEMRAADATHDTVVRGVTGAPPYSVWTLRGGRVVGAAAVDDGPAV